MSLVEPKPKPRPWFAMWRRESGSFAQLSLMARALFGEILKLTDDDGVIELGGREPAAAIAWALGATRSDRRALERCIPELLEDGCLVHEGDRLIAPSFRRWQPKERAPKQPRSGHDRATTVPRTSHDTVTNGSRPCHETEGNDAEVLNTTPESRVEESKVEYIPPKGSPALARDSVFELFEHWRAAFGKSGATKLDAQRRRRIVWALKTYGLDACKRCVDGYATSEYHLGGNESGTRYDDLELFFRNAKHFEAGLAHAEKLEVKAAVKRRAAEREQRDRERERERQREIEARAVAPGELKKLLGPYVREAAE